MRQLLFIFSFLLTSLLSAGNIYYVKQGGIGNGTSWADASGDLQKVINAASPDDEVRVAKGTYYPQYTVGGGLDPRSSSFMLKDRVKVIGGFKGEDESEVSEPYKYETTLSGNIGSLSSIIDNVYHVVYIKNIGSFEQFHLEGFTIVDGYANSSGLASNNSGAAIYIHVGMGATVTIINNKMAENRAHDSGGAIYCMNSSTANIRIHNNFIHNNWAINGEGGGINLASPANLTIQGNTIVRNSASQGAGVSILSKSGKINVYNNIMWDNVTAGSDFYSELENNLDIQHNIFTVKQESMELDSTNFIGINPAFNNPSMRDYSLTQYSPAINNGKNSFVPFEVMKDLNGEARYVQTVDIGAYEFQAIDEIIVPSMGVIVNGIRAGRTGVSNFYVQVEYSQKPWYINVLLISPHASYKIFAKDKVTLINNNNIELELGDQNFFWIEVIPKEGPLFKSFYQLQVKMIPKPLWIDKMTIKDKSKDNTLKGELENQGDLIGVVNDDTVSVDYSKTEVLFENVGHAMDIPVMISGLKLVGSDSLYYRLVLPTHLKGNILNDDASIIVIVDGRPHDITKIYDLKCENINSINVEVVIDQFATLAVFNGADSTSSKYFTVITDRPIYKEVALKVTSQDGKNIKTYVLKIEKRLPFDDVVKTKWDNTFAVNIAELKSRALFPKKYQWYKNNMDMVGETNSYLAAGPKETNYLDEGASYHVALTFEDGTTIRTCSKQFVRTTRNAFAVYPNPARVGESIYLQADNETYPSEGARIEIYNLSGSRISNVNTQPDITELPTMRTSGTYFVKYVGKDGNSKSTKVIVK